MKKLLFIMTLALIFNVRGEYLVYRYKLKGVELKKKNEKAAYTNKKLRTKGYVVIDYDTPADTFYEAVLYEICTEKTYCVKPFFSKDTKIKRIDTEKGMVMTVSDAKGTLQGGVRSGIKCGDLVFLAAKRLKGQSSWNCKYDDGSENIGSADITLAFDALKTKKTLQITSKNRENSTPDLAAVLGMDGYTEVDATGARSDDNTLEDVIIYGGSIDDIEIGYLSGDKATSHAWFGTLVVGMENETSYMMPSGDGSAGETIVTDGAGNLSWTKLSSGGDSSVLTDDPRLTDARAWDGSFKESGDKTKALSALDITSFPGFGTAAGKACQGDDSRLSDARSWNGTFRNQNERTAAFDALFPSGSSTDTRQVLSEIEAQTGKNLIAVFNDIGSDPHKNFEAILDVGQSDGRYLNTDACLAEFVMNRENDTAKKMSNLQRLRNNTGLGGFLTEFETDADGNIVMDIVNGVFVPRSADSKVTTNLDVEGDFTLGSAGNELDISMFVADKSHWKVNDMNIDEFLGVDTSSLEDKFLDEDANLSDVPNKATARTNMDVYAKGETDNRYLNESGNLGDLDNAGTARSNLGLGALATLDNVTTSQIVNGTIGRDDLNNGDFGAWVSTTDPETARRALGVNDTTSWDDITGKPATATRWPTWSEVTGKPSFHTVATSGDYNDLLNKPTIPSSANTLIAQHHAGREWAFVRELRTDDGLRKLEYYNVMYVAGGDYSFTVPLTEHLSSLQGFPSIMITDHSDAGAPSRNPYVTLIDGSTIHFRTAVNTQKVYIHVIWYGVAP